ncbi:hypothetical protein KP509_23G042100 [Ceratopteris richardii]|nr:hypothetical protein KP509_23G042100 [Ceratopteris richardii]
MEQREENLQVSAMQTCCYISEEEKEIMIGSCREPLGMIHFGNLSLFDGHLKHNEDVDTGALKDSEDGHARVNEKPIYTNCGGQLEMQIQGAFSGEIMEESQSGNAYICRMPKLANTGEQKDMEISEVVAQTFCQMPQQENVLVLSPDNALAIVNLLADCAKKKDLNRGSKLHVDIAGSGFFESNAFVGCALLNMYAKCGVIHKAEQVFNRFSVRNAVSWNALISGYTQLGYSNEALASFKQMQEEGLPPDAVTFACILKACSNVYDVDMGHVLHAMVLRQGFLESNVVVANSLIDMYVKHGFLANAQAVFDELRIQDSVSWNVLIFGHAQHGYAQESLNLFECMKDHGFCPDAFTYVCVFKACADIGNSVKGQEVHNEIIKGGLENANLVVGSVLIRMYAECGMLAEAQRLFDELPTKNVVIWTALIEGYVQQNDAHRAFCCFEQMKEQRVSPDDVLFSCILKACGSVGDSSRGQKIHLEIVMDQLLDGNMVIASSLLHMYGDCGLLAEAQEVFDELSARNVALWTSLLAIYVQNGCSAEALDYYRQMQIEGFLPDEMIFASIIKACSSLAALVEGQQIHAEIVKRGLLDIDTAVPGSLIDMYAKCGLLEDAEYVFEHLIEQDVVSYSAFISGCAQHGQGERAINCYEHMKADGGFSPNAFTFASILKACVSIKAACKGKEIHSEIVKVGYKDDIVIGTALVDMYGKFGMLDEAQLVLERLPLRDVFTWSSLISGYVQHALDDQALCCLAQMELEGVFPNAITFASSLKACGSIGAIGMGKRLHAEIVKHGLFEENIWIGSELVDMYVSCGMISEAENVFNELPIKDTHAWNTLIAGYVLFGDIELVLKTYGGLLKSGKEPDSATFTLILNACTGRGSLDSGQYYFEMMSMNFDLIPGLEHWNCIIDLFGRCGLLDYAIAVIEIAPILASSVIWHSLIAACQRAGNVNFGQWAFENARQANDMDGAAYVSLCNTLHSSCLY